ncbi:phage tail assembly chaperone [Allosphingosinicella sp.]|uniref:phage tail assembly chaperone n=1 Tax=Allosphingosinicella sp. TaxID=2823234 RepID=UPI002F249144
MFSEAAARLAGFAGALLGWPPDSFWRSTPAELAAVFGASAEPSRTVSTDEIERLKRMFPDG